ncbi:hypothetical protein RDWZM_010148 [Blomia tropicalis]|uniref:Uncharacterized protein n=1 Tax=Blomia tropicalis TaxID=40697 RepID=A0A9Q0RHF3_BLOTA|nr:hypothetical protein RDWZM_010148 [Blomia tropicalis]
MELFFGELNTKNDYTALDARDSSNRTQIDKERNEWNEDDGQCSTKIEGNRFTDEVNVPDTPEVAEVQV